MYTYKTEILTVGTKWWTDKANDKDAAELDALLNRPANLTLSIRSFS